LSGTAVRSERPASVGEAAALLRELGAAGSALRVRGGGTKLEWAGPLAAGIELETGGLDRVIEHNEGDFTAVLEAGVPLARAQERFAAAGQMLALDPPLAGGDGEPRATIGGVVASADSGPLRHRYGGVRDLVVGITVVLSDGTVAKAGGRVIKNVAGYDLGKLFAGSLGTLGLIASVAVRLHPLPAETATARGASDDPGALARAAGRLAALPFEAECLDAGWAGECGELLVRFAGATAAERAERAAALMGELGLERGEVIEDDLMVWAGQRSRQRSGSGAVLKVSAVMGDLAAVLEAARRLGAVMAGRAALGLSWLALPEAADVKGALATLRGALPGAWVRVLDGAGAVSDPWPGVDPGALAVMERVKARFDPARVFAPGSFAGGL